MLEWYDNRFTGLFTHFARVALRPHDPSLTMTAGEMPSWYAGESPMGCGGAGWSEQEADLACLGEGIERLLARILPCDHSIHASWSAWPLAEPAVDPCQWVLFHPEQYGQPGFPFIPFTRDTPCRWVCCRRAGSGTPVWVPEEMVFLQPRRGECQQYVNGFSTGLSAGQKGQPILLRGAQEIIERDALVGAWWKAYAIEEWSGQVIRSLLGTAIWQRVDRPNLRWRFYRIRTPFSDHVTLVSLEGLDHEGSVFSVGSACRETRQASWEKSVLEAVQGRHCVRRLLADWQEAGRPDMEVPTTFFEHALYYGIHPQRRMAMVLHQATPAMEESTEVEGLEVLRGKLGENRPILFRNLTPPPVVEHFPEWMVLRVLIPGLQPLHGDHRLPFLGGPLWRPRGWVDWGSVPPHPFA